jgi:hypothetical protein
LIRKPCIATAMRCDAMHLAGQPPAVGSNAIHKSRDMIRQLQR